jgi:Flp pilus assembly protein TadD
MVLVRVLALTMLLLAAPGRAQTHAPSVALSTEEAIGLATAWIVEGRLDEADALLRQLAAALPPDPQVLFLQAQSALQRRDYGAASTKLRELLSRDPSLVRVRLDLARALFLAGDYGASRYHFELALGEDLPAAARENVHLYLRYIQAQTAWLEMTFYVGRDSNPGSATSARTVEILGQSFLVDEASKAKPAWGAAMRLQGRAAFGAEDRSYARAQLDLRDYEGGYADYHYAEAALGYTAGVDRAWSIEAGPLAAVYQNELLYQGVLAELAHRAPLGKRALTLQSVGLRHLAYREFDYLSATEAALRLQLRYAPDPVSQVALGLSLAHSDAREDAYSYDAWDWSVGYLREFPRHFNLDVRVSLGRVDYADEWTLFGEMRRDRLLRADITLIARDWTVRGFAPLLSAGHARTRSTIDVAQFERSYVSVGFTRTF